MNLEDITKIICAELKEKMADVTIQNAEDYQDRQVNTLIDISSKTVAEIRSGDMGYQFQEQINWGYRALKGRSANCDDCAAIVVYLCEQKKGITKTKYYISHVQIKGHSFNIISMEEIKNETTGNKSIILPGNYYIIDVWNDLTSKFNKGLNINYEKIGNNTIAKKPEEIRCVGSYLIDDSDATTTNLLEL